MAATPGLMRRPCEETEGPDVAEGGDRGTALTRREGAGRPGGGLCHSPEQVGAASTCGHKCRWAGLTVPETHGSPPPGVVVSQGGGAGPQLRWRRERRPGLGEREDGGGRQGLVGQGPGPTGRPTGTGGWSFPCSAQLQRPSRAVGGQRGDCRADTTEERPGGMEGVGGCEDPEEGMGEGCRTQGGEEVGTCWKLHPPGVLEPCCRRPERGWGSWTGGGGNKAQA